MRGTEQAREMQGAAQGGLETKDLSGKDEAWELKFVIITCPRATIEPRIARASSGLPQAQAGWS